MPAYVYLASSGLVMSLFLFRWALSGTHVSSNAAARRNLGISDRAGRRMAAPRSLRVAQLVQRIPLFGEGEDLQRRLKVAGMSWRSENVRFFRVASLATAFVLGALLAVATSSAAVFGLFLSVGAIAAVAPDSVIRAKSNERQQKLEHELPDILDRLKITLEAGLGFDSALSKVVHGRSGPAYDEFSRVLQDLQLGIPRDEALQALSDRTNITDLRLVLAAVVQSGRYGLPLVEVLRIQTEELRDKRWQNAQERALKVPVKILFPLITCILPTFFIILVGPSFIKLLRTL